MSKPKHINKKFDGFAEIPKNIKKEIDEKDPKLRKVSPARVSDLSKPKNRREKFDDFADRPKSKSPRVESDFKLPPKKEAPRAETKPKARPQASRSPPTS